MERGGVRWLAMGPCMLGAGRPLRAKPTDPTGNIRSGFVRHLLPTLDGTQVKCRLYMQHRIASHRIAGRSCGSRPGERVWPFGFPFLLQLPARRPLHSIHYALACTAHSPKPLLQILASTTLQPFSPWSRHQHNILLPSYLSLA
jgi:hypothetical protein